MHFEGGENNNRRIVQSRRAGLGCDVSEKKERDNLFASDEIRKRRRRVDYGMYVCIPYERVECVPPLMIHHTLSCCTSSNNLSDPIAARLSISVGSCRVSRLHISQYSSRTYSTRQCKQEDPTRKKKYMSHSVLLLLA